MRHWFASAFIGLVAFSLALGADSVCAEEVLLDSPGTGTFIVPNNVNELAVELWGAGGAGGDVSSGGGGGGAYRSGTLTVNPGESLPYHVGRGARSESEVPGETSWFGSPGALSAGGGNSARNRGTRQGGSGSNAGTYAGGDGGSGAWLVGGGGGSSAGREQDGNPGNGSSPGNAPAGGGDGGAGGGSIFIFGGSGEPGEQPGGGGGGAGSGLFGGGSGGSGGDGLIRVIYTAEGGCDASFPDGISSYNGGNIDFGYNSQLIGSPDGTLSAGKISRNGGSNLGTCGSVDCEAGDSAALPLNLPPFPAIGAPADSSVGVGYNQSVIVGGGGNRFESISTGYLSTLTFSGNQDTYYIGALNLGSSSQVYLRPGDYYIESISINSQVDVRVLGAGTARLFIKNNVNLGSPSFFNSPGVNQAGDSSKLLLASYSDVYFQNNATLSGAVFALGDINLGSSSYLHGGATAGNITLGTDSRLYFQDQGLSNIDFGGTCPAGGDEVVDHFEIVHSGTGLTCSPASVTIRACDDASCSQTFPDSVEVTLAPSGWVGGDTFTFTGQANRSLRVTSAGTVSLGVTGSDPGSEGATLCGTNSDDLSPDNCEMTFYDSGFAISVPDHVADTKVQATIAAVRKNKETEQCVPGFSEENKDVALWFKYVNPSDGNKSVFRVVEDDEDVPLPEGGADDTTSLYFDENGEETVDIRYPDVGQVRLHARHDGMGDAAGLVMLGDGMFVARPARFELAASVLESDGRRDSPAATDADDPVFVAAGAEFDIEVSALNASGNITPNFGREGEGVKLDVELFKPTSGTEEPLNGSFEDFGEDCDENAQPGVACGQFKWPEVGIITVIPSLISESYLGTGQNVIGDDLPYLGRFKPSSFAVEVFDKGELQASCGEIHFVGQPMLWPEESVPTLSITALSEGGNITKNYTSNDDFLKLAASDIAIDFPNSQTVNVDGEETPLSVGFIQNDGELVVASNPGQMYYEFSASDRIWLEKNKDARVASFPPKLSFAVEAFSDSDGVPSDDLPVPFVTGPEEDSDDAFKLYYGRLNMENVYGPQNIEKLLMPVHVQVWNGGGWNVVDVGSCMPTNLGDIKGWGETTQNYHELDDSGFDESSNASNYYLKLTPSGTCPEDEDCTDVLEWPLKSGADLEAGDKPDNYDWLMDFWGRDSKPNELQNPRANATFGVYRGNDRIIYWHEVLN